MSITENVRMARQKINAAAESAGRSGSEVRLLAATKMNGPEAVQEAIRAGVDICAENRVQEFLSKNAVNAYAPCCVHFIGHLQKNKGNCRFKKLPTVSVILLKLHLVKLLKSNLS